MAVISISVLSRRSAALSKLLVGKRASLSICTHRKYTSKKHLQEVKPPGKAKGWIIRKYLGFVDRMEKTLEKKSPRVYKIYMLFKIGIREFFLDSKTYYGVVTGLWQNKKLSDFSRHQLDCYQKMPGDLLRVGPTVIFLNIPITDTILPFVIYFFPRQLLSRHFWTPKQRLEFGQYYLRSRLTHLPNVVRYLDRHAKDVKDPGLKRLLDCVLLQLDQKEIPHREAIIDLKPLFIDKPFGIHHLATIHKIHSYHLAKALHMTTRKKKLLPETTLMMHIDKATYNEKLTSLTLAQAQEACFDRCLDPTSLDREEIDEYLHRWLMISSHIDESSLSLLLHLPVFLAMNHPSNIKLLQTKKKSSH